MNRHGEIIVQDDSGRERERYGLVYGAHLLVSEGDARQGRRSARRMGSLLHAHRHRGRRHRAVRRHHRGRDHEEELDEVTGLSRKVIIESKDSEARPRDQHQGRERRHRRCCPTRKAVARYYLPVGANIFVNEGDRSRPAR